MKHGALLATTLSGAVIQRKDRIAGVAEHNKLRFTVAYSKEVVALQIRPSIVKSYPCLRPSKSKLSYDQNRKA
jgi:hypothetical protein